MPPTSTPPLPVLLYDGDCAFCSTCARFVERRVPVPAAPVPWQFTDLDALGVAAADVDASVVWVISPNEHRHGPAAIAALLSTSTGAAWRALGRILAAPPVRIVAEPVYRLVARNRHRMPGGTAACALPAAMRTAQEPSGAPEPAPGPGEPSGPGAGGHAT